MREIPVMRRLVMLAGMPEDLEEVMWDQVKTFTLLPYRDKVRHEIFIFLTIRIDCRAAESGLYVVSIHAQMELFSHCSTAGAWPR